MSSFRHRNMRARAHRALVIAFIVSAASGCASGQRAQREREVATLRTQVEELKAGQQQSARELGRLTGEIKALDAQSAFLVAETKSMSESFARVRTSLEDSGKAIRELQSSVEELRKPAPAAVPPPAPTRPPPPSPAADASPEQIFAAAMASFQAEEHGQAVLEWNELTKRFPEDPLASNAQYWIGEAYYRQRDFPQALVEFRKVIDGYPKSSQVPETLLKIGLCHRALKDAARARETWEQLAKDYPGSNAALQARSLLSASAPSSRPVR
jgi:tol-pal system protein YbgF